MRSYSANGSSRLSLWLRVREFAVPQSMIETTTARRTVGDWAGACAAARVDVDLDLRSVARRHGSELAARIRADLREFAPDLLRWHMPRIAPDGLLRPGLTISLARYRFSGPDHEPSGPEHEPCAPDDDLSGQGCAGTGGGTVHLVVRTPPAWADAGQRISLALWDGSRPEGGPCSHPHPHPDPRFRLDLHRHLWNGSQAGELRVRSGVDQLVDPGQSGSDWTRLRERGLAVDRWAAEAKLLLRAEKPSGGAVLIRIGSRERMVLDLSADDADNDGATGGACGADPGGACGADQTGGTGGTGVPRLRVVPARDRAVAVPVLPDAATWVPPDLMLLRAGLIEPDRLHPLVAAALVPEHAPDGRTGRTGPHLVECRGAEHRIGVVDGLLAPLDHDPDELRREELLVALGGTPLPCLQMIDEVHRNPECLLDVEARLAHGDTVGAVAAVEGLLGPDALLRDGSLRDGSLRDELETAALRRVAHGLYRAGLAGLGPVAGPVAGPVRGQVAGGYRRDRTWTRRGGHARDGELYRNRRARPRHASAR